MPIRTCLLVRYRGGYVEVYDDAAAAIGGRREGFISFDVSGEPEAILLAQQVLSVVGSASFAASTELFVDAFTPAPKPLTGWQLGDAITIPNATLNGTQNAQVVGLTLGTDENGALAYVPQFGQRQDEAEARLQRAMRRMVLGTLDGASDAATPSRPRAPVSRKHKQTRDPIVFSFPGSVVVGLSPRWYLRDQAVIKAITVSMNTPGGSDTVVEVYRNGSAYQTITLGSGVDKVVVELGNLVNAGDYFRAGVTTVGSGTPEDLAVQIDFAIESDPPSQEQSTA